MRTSSITIRFSLVGEGCFRAAGFGGGERRLGAAALGAGILGTADALGGEEATAAALGGGEAAPAGFGLRRRRGLVGDEVNASRCIRLFSTSWDLSTAAVAMSTDPRGRLQRGRRDV
jgi:hypothetical protein